jgi:putative ABC transport system substrate-binding protein
MKRREFISLVGGAAVLPLAARAQQQAVPVVGLLRSTTAGPFADLVAALRQGLSDEGFEERRTVVLEQRWANNDLERLPVLARELAERRAAVIVGNQTAVDSVRKVAPSTPVVFVTGEDPIRAGLVKSLSRPGGNVTGVTFFGGSQLNGKRMELLHELVPAAKTVAVLGDPGYTAFERELPAVEAGARRFGWRLVVERAAHPSEFERAFAAFADAKADAVLVSGSPLFTSQGATLPMLAQRHKLPAIYDVRNLVAAGGLISYSSSISGAYHQAGEYAGRILKGAKAAELPVLQATIFELAINLQAAKALGLTIPPTLLARASEVIE